MKVKKGFLIISMIVTLLIAFWALRMDKAEYEDVQENQTLLDEVRRR